MARHRKAPVRQLVGMLTLEHSPDAQLNLVGRPVAAIQSIDTWR